MSKTVSNSFPIIDAHIHYGSPSFMPDLMMVVDELGVDKINIVCTPHQSRLSLVPDALHLKAHHPERIFVFGGLDISTLFIAPDQAGVIFADYVDTLSEMGCDGLKMIEGKPDMHKMLPLPPFDGDVYAPLWERLEERGTPLVFHVNDPEEFWDEERIPEWALERGWFYGDGTYVDNEGQYTQIINVLERHPGLNVIFAHFFFLSAQLPRLGDLLDRFPNMCVDLTPGIEMYRNFARMPDETRDFFIQYQDRIVYGTDIGAKALLATPELGIEMGESSSRAFLVQSFLEREGEFELPASEGFLFGDSKDPFRGIKLPPEVLEKIYHRNFERMAGSEPKPLNPRVIVEECARLSMMIDMMQATQPELETDKSIAEMVAAHFEALS